MAERVLVVVPTCSERENVRPLLRELLAQSEGVNVWVADDGSPDGTADAVREVMAEHRGGWSASGEWIPVPYVDEGEAEKLFRHKVLALLRRKGLLTEERIELLLSWRRSDFSVHNRVYVPAGDRQGLEALVRTMMRSPVSLSRLRFTPGSPEVVNLHKGGHDEIEPTEGERVDAMEFVARVLAQIPDGRRHLARYYGFYLNAARGKRKKASAPAPAEPSCPIEAPEGAAIPDGPHRAALRRRWAEMIRRL